MKTCPVCRTTLFEDMEVCYGCLYHFGSEPALEKTMGGLEGASRPQGGDLRRWMVRLEVRSLSDPGQVWAAELIPPYEDEDPSAASMPTGPGGRPNAPGGIRAGREGAPMAGV